MKSFILSPLFLTLAALLTIGLLIKQSFFFSHTLERPPEIQSLTSSWHLYHSQEWHLNKQTPTEQTYILAQSVIHFDTQNSTRLETPLIIRKTQDTLYSLEADHAQIEQQKHTTLIQLIDNAKLINYTPTPPYQWQTYLTSSRFNYNEQTQTLSNQTSNRIEQPGLVILGNNLISNIQSQDFSLQKAVKTLYSPQ